MAPGRKGNRDVFADELKAHRAQRGWTQADMAAKVNYSESLIAQVETCHRAATVELARALDAVFKTPGWTENTPGTFERLASKLRDLPYPASFRSFAPYEAKAMVLRTFQHVLVPGLLQTEDYARSVLETRPNTTRDELETLVAARLERQAVLDRQDPPLLWALLDEGVLNRPIGNPGVMHAQLLHMAELSKRPNITVQVIPYSAGGHVGLEGAFVIAEMSDSPGIVFLETAADGQTIEDAAIVTQVALRFDSLRDEALPKGTSRDMIVRVAKERWKEAAS
jgi:transcriptional regulator with XRE-family HTH domain